MSQQQAISTITAADPSPEFFALATTYGLGWGHVEHTSCGTVLAFTGTEDALRAFMAREDTWGLDEDQLTEFIKLVEPMPSVWGFHASASVWFNTDAAGNVVSLDINVLDGVDHPREMWEMDGDTPAHMEIAEQVYDRAVALKWALPANIEFPTGRVTFGGAIA